MYFRIFQMKAFVVLALLLMILSPSLSANSLASLDKIFNEIESLESHNDAKCYATSSRLEDFMFGTPLDDEARFAKNLLQKQWVDMIWEEAAEFASLDGSTDVLSKHTKQAIQNHFDYQLKTNSDWVLNFGESNQVIINKRDKRQYGSVSYSLRALLAAADELRKESQLKDELLPLSEQAIDDIKEALDLYSLAVLKTVDQQSRLLNLNSVSEKGIRQTWLSLDSQIKRYEKKQSKKLLNATQPLSQQSTQTNLALLKRIIQQKVSSYQKYNNVTNQVFLRNLQVYFVRNSWPKDEQVAKLFRQYFTETLIHFAADLLKGAEQLALQASDQTISESHVKRFSYQFIPHDINEYEDALFFPKLAKSHQVFIESYDMDAFRDSGIHWSNLKHAIETPNLEVSLPVDPFAAELLAENIAQFGVLILRLTGEAGIKLGEERIRVEHFVQAMNLIQQRIHMHADKKNHVKVEKVDAIKSANNGQSESRLKNAKYFTEVTKDKGLEMQHRSSDWLNRLLRSYLKKDEATGIITIPPAFGGSGVAAEDINNDGLADILILSGLGNRLYLNKGGFFEDITQAAGLDWIRPEDKQPGEPRQPLIADLNNDGLQDIVITYVDDEHRVYKNNGDLTFSDVTHKSLLGGGNLVGGPATVFDYDNDGLLDVYISYFGNYLKGELPTLKRRNDNGLPNQLFKNMGDFVFKNVTDGSGLDNTGWGQALTHTDLDGDGWQDLIVGNDFGVNAYYKNLRNGQFKDIAATLGTDKPSYTMSLAVSDLNDDLIPDIYVSNIVTMNKDEKYVLPNEQTKMKFNPDSLANMRVVEANDLFMSSENNKLPSYRLSDLVGRGYSSTGWAWDADFFDYDNDGDDDLYVLNGMNEFNVYSRENPYYTDPNDQTRDITFPESHKDTNVFFTNKAGRLHNESQLSGVDLLANSRSAAYFDTENDGDLDIVLNNYHDSVIMYQNNAENLDNNWLKIKLIGAPESAVNLDAIGARLIITTSLGDVIWREIHGSTGYLSVHPKEQHVGLGMAKSARIKIIWPNGLTQEKGTFAANKRYKIAY